MKDTRLRTQPSPSETPSKSAQHELGMLAQFALRAAESRGRAHDEPDDPLRTCFQRDRDRIVHSTAFRRLEYKTQVFVNHEGDHYRTRLTHTLEVAQISRTVARVLGLNEDLVEAIALSHDLGHPPFGHAGEEKLDELMRGHGGFNHNCQSLRVVDELEQRYPDFPGLNLSWEIRESIVKHYGRFDQPGFEIFEPEQKPLLEAQLADVGDSLAYNSHDLDDGLRSGYLSLDALRDLELWQLAEAGVRERWPNLDGRELIARGVSRVIGLQVGDLIEATRQRLDREGIRSVTDVRNAARTLVAFSDEMTAQRLELQSFLMTHLYKHPRCRRIAEKGKRFIEQIFGEYLRDPSQLPLPLHDRLLDGSVPRVVCDYLAGMTDRFCLQEYRRLFVPFADEAAGDDAIGVA